MIHAGRVGENLRIRILSLIEQGKSRKRPGKVVLAYWIWKMAG